MKKIFLSLLIISIFILLAYSIEEIKKIISVNVSKNFEILNNGYAKDNNYVYFTKLTQPIEEDPTNYYEAIKDKRNYKIVRGADPDTFEALEFMFGKDKDNVYCGINNIKADPKSFKLLKDHYYYRGQDKDSAYDCNGKIGTAGGILTVLNWHYKKDEKNVYYGPGNEIVEFADPQSFEVVSTYEGKDKNSFYAYGKKMDNIDPSSYISLGRFYAKDKQLVYKEYSVIVGADPNSFEVMSDAYAKDKNNVFYMSHKLEEADLLSFKALSEVYAIDKNNEYCRNFIIKGVDRDAFKASKNCPASDKDRSYDCHKCESYSL